MKYQSGFTLIEIAIVLLIVGILLGYTVALLPVQKELSRYRDVEKDMDRIVDALIGFAQVQGRLPCPDISGGAAYDGRENTDDVADNVTGALLPGGDGITDSCEGYFGFLPKVTLGLNGPANATNNLLDPWGQRYGYAISDINAGADSLVDLVTTNGIRREGLNAMIANPPDLNICDSSPGAGNNLTCPAANTVIANVAVVIISLGKDYRIDALGNASSAIQTENIDDFDDGTNDKVYVSSTRSEATGAEYDDVIRWISPSHLFANMIAAEQLP